MGTSLILYTIFHNSSWKWAVPTLMEHHNSIRPKKSLSFSLSLSLSFLLQLGKEVKEKAWGILAREREREVPSFHMKSWYINLLCISALLYVRIFYHGCHVRLSNIWKWMTANFFCGNMPWLHVALLLRGKWYFTWAFCLADEHYVF